MRCHSVVKLLRAQNPDRPVDMVSSTLCAPIADYMPGVRQAIISDQPRKRLGWAIQQDLAARLRQNGYGQALVMSRKWKAALAPFLAGIPVRTGFAGEARFGLINDMRWGERHLPRMIDQMGALALPKGAALPSDWPLPELRVPADELARWRELRGLTPKTARLSPCRPARSGPARPGRRAIMPNWRARSPRTAPRSGCWAAPARSEIARQIAETGGPAVRDLTGTDLRNAILALAAADVSVTNDSGLMHVSAAIGTPTVAIFGPTSPWHWKPLNPVAAILEPPGDDEARLRARTEGNDAVRHRSTAGVAVESVLAAVRAVLGQGR